MRHIAIAGIVLLASGVALGAWLYLQPGCPECRNSLVESLTKEDITISENNDASPQFLFGRGFPRNSKIENLTLETINGELFTLAGYRSIIYHSRAGCSLCTIVELAIRDAVLHSGTTTSQWIFATSGNISTEYLQALLPEVNEHLKILTSPETDRMVEAIGTEVAPVITLVDESVTVQAMWRGFDPAHGDDIIKTIQLFLANEQLPENAGETQLTLGELAPPLHLEGFLPIGKSGNRTVVHITDATCPACQNVHEGIARLFARLAMTGKVDLRVVDITPNENVIKRRQEFILRHSPHLVSSLMPLGETSEMTKLQFPDTVTHIYDPNATIRLAWTNDITPNVYIFDERGYFERAIPFRSATNNHRPFLRSVEKAALGL